MIVDNKKEDPGRLSGKRISLRLIKEQDLMLTLSWRNQDRVRQMFLTSYIITQAGHFEWFKKYLTKTDDLLFLIEKQPDATAIGQIGIYNIDYKNKVAEYGRLIIGPTEELGKGYAEEASNIVFDFCKTALKLDHLYLEVKNENLPAQKLYKKLGFSPATNQSNAKVLKLTKKL